VKSVMDDGGGGDARSVTHDVVDEEKVWAIRDVVPTTETD